MSVIASVIVMHIHHEGIPLWCSSSVNSTDDVTNINGSSHSFNLTAATGENISLRNEIFIISIVASDIYL